MIGVTVNHEGNTLLMSLPTDELYDHLGSIGITKGLKNSKERAKIPEQLCSHIAKICEVDYRKCVADSERR